MNINMTAKRPLTTDELRAAAPSIFTKHKHHSRSDRYGHQPTIEVLDTLRKAGFVPVQAFQSRIHRDVRARTPYAKHLIRLRERRWVEADLKPDMVIPDVILTNSHDGTSAFRLEAGLYRLVCSNGLVVASASFGSVSIPHTAKIGERVREGAQIISKHVPQLMRVTKEWDKIKLTQRTRNAFARDALAMRFHGTPPITIEQALENRRNEDEAPTLWRTFNTIQENLLTGGQIGRSASGRATRVRLVKSVNNSLHYNRSLWLLAEGIAEKS